jgi:murein DD-endopeptidase MepM/ murein hydrolase activator NlpD
MVQSSPASHAAALVSLAIIGGFVAACTSPDPYAVPPTAAAPDEDHPHGDESTAAPANTDPAIGSDGVEPEPGDTAIPLGDASAPTPADAGRDASVPDASSPADRAASPVPGRSVTYPYGVKNSRYAAGYHTGDDYGAPLGTKVVAVRNGVVRWSNDSGGAYGKWMGIEADNGRVYVYCHLSVRSVASGSIVKANQVIGKVGATGNVTGPHLHFEDHPKGPFTYGRGRKPAW